MARKISYVLIVFVVIALVVGVVAGYLVQTGELSVVRESKSMIEEELKAAKTDLAKAQEGKSMLEEELKGKTTSIAFVPEQGQMAHDLWLLIAPVGGGKYALSVRAEGLDHAGPEDVYLLEGVTKTEPMQTIPLGSTMDVSEFHANKDGTATHWLVLDKDPRTAFDKILILYLPGMQMERAVLTAVAKLG